MTTRLRIILISIGVFVALIVAYQVFKDHLAERAFERGVERNVGVDSTARLADGIHIYMCGTGSPMPDTLRAGPCIGVLAGEEAFVFDSGSGGIRKLQRMGFPMNQLTAGYLTHLHSDHIDGLGELLLQAWIAGSRDNPLPIIGPVGTERVVAAFNDAYTIDRGYRIAHHGTDVANPAGFGGIAQEIQLPAGPDGNAVVYESGPIRITAIRVEHAPVEPAFGYRIDYRDRSVSISGDTIYHPGFVAASEGVDVMLHEALDPEMVQIMEDALKANDRPLTAKIMFDILDYHATPEDAAKAASQADALELVYYHIVPPLPSPRLNSMWLGDASDYFDGKMTVATDGSMISLPSDSQDVLHRRGF